MFRDIDYATLFFHAACNGAYYDYEKSQMLKYAFDNGFNSYEKLVEAANGGLKSLFDHKILNIVPSTDDPKKFEVTLFYEQRPKTAFLKIKFIYPHIIVNTQIPELINMKTDI